MSASFHLTPAQGRVLEEAGSTIRLTYQTGALLRNGVPEDQPILAELVCLQTGIVWHSTRSFREEDAVASLLSTVDLSRRPLASAEAKQSQINNLERENRDLKLQLAQLLAEQTGEAEDDGKKSDSENDGEAAAAKSQKNETPPLPRRGRPAKGPTAPPLPKQDHPPRPSIDESDQEFGRG